jgi:hypothetical protein
MMIIKRLKEKRVNINDKQQNHRTHLNFFLNLFKITPTQTHSLTQRIHSFKQKYFSFIRICSLPTLRNVSSLDNGQSRQKNCCLR